MLRTNPHQPAYFSAQSRIISNGHFPKVFFPAWTRTSVPRQPAPVSCINPR